MAHAFGGVLDLEFGLDPEEEAGLFEGLKSKPTPLALLELLCCPLVIRECGSLVELETDLELTPLVLLGLLCTASFACFLLSWIVVSGSSGLIPYREFDPLLDFVRTPLVFPGLLDDIAG